MPNERYRLANPCLHKLCICIYIVASKQVVMRRLFCSTVELKLYTGRIADENDSDFAVFRSSAEGKK